MARRLIALFLTAGLTLFGMTGCKKSPEETPKTKAEFKAEADKEITEENMNKQLENLEREVDADTAEEE